MSAAAEFPMMHAPKAETHREGETGESGPVLVETRSVLQKQGTAAAIEGLETVGRLAGGVAHDFNNLLTGILLYCDLLNSSLDPGHAARRYVAEIREASVQASGLVRQLLAVARPALSGAQLLSLNDIAAGMRSMLARLIGENIELNYRLEMNPGMVWMDPAQAQQIVLNLVLNARDAMTEGGEILLETRNCRMQILPDASLGAEGAVSLPCVLMVIADNGSGMDEATRGRAFETFFTTKTGGKGTGLGLATVQQIVRGSGGLIHLDSAPGRGTRVTVLLPVASATSISQNAGEPQEQEMHEGVLPAGEKE